MTFSNIKSFAARRPPALLASVRASSRLCAARRKSDCTDPRPLRVMPHHRSPTGPASTRNVASVRRSDDVSRRYLPSPFSLSDPISSASSVLIGRTSTRPAALRLSPDTSIPLATSHSPSARRTCSERRIPSRCLTRRRPSSVSSLTRKAVCFNIDIALKYNPRYIFSNHPFGQCIPPRSRFPTRLQRRAQEVTQFEESPTNGRIAPSSEGSSSRGLTERDRSLQARRNLCASG